MPANDSAEQNVDFRCIMPENIVVNPGEHPELEIWLGGSLRLQSIYVINPVFSLILEHYL
jgi:hypothetical protein